MMQKETQNWVYTVGLLTSEVNQEMLTKSGFDFKEIIPEDEIKKTIPECLNAEYKNPSSMREDAPHAFSCSSLVSYLYVKAGIWMPSLSIDKYVFGESVEMQNIKYGDLIFSNTGEGIIRTETVEYKKGTYVPEGVDHVGMYVGEGKVLHASKSIGKVGVEFLNEAKNFKNIVGVRRYGDLNQERYIVTVPDEFKNLLIPGALLKEIIELNKK